jgi:quercetin dioxygenase-like cupin family protein
MIEWNGPEYYLDADNRQPHQETSMRSLTLATALTVLLVSRLDAQAAPPLKWGPAPAVFPKGARMAVLQGDPGSAALFTVRLDMPPGYKLPPHFHPTDEHVTVIQGTFLVGMGDKLDLAHAMLLGPGGFITAGANQHHFAAAKGHVVVQVHAMGPFALTYVNPADDPQKRP